MRIFGKGAAGVQPRIERSSVERFFQERAGKLAEVGALKAVLYQDKHPDLAQRRDAAEKTRIRPLLRLDGHERLLDVGSGTGRWTDELAGAVAYYHGIDFSAGLVEYARQRHPPGPQVGFTVASADDYTLDSLGVEAPFDVILCCGVMIYLNDEEVDRALRCMAGVCAPSARIVLREPVGISDRLTISEHYSDEMEQTYNAIYRTEEELVRRIGQELGSPGFRITGTGDVYEAGLNNRAETVQRWFVVERS